MTVSPGEVRRRADMVAIVGELPEFHHDFVAELAETVPDLSGANARAFFLIGTDGSWLPPLNGKPRATVLSCEGRGSGATLAALRARCAGRQVSAPISNFEAFEGSLARSRFPVFLFSGQFADGLSLEMLQGLVADLNRKSRASSLHLPASASGWGGSLASTWMTGFPLRTGFARGLPEFDPWRFDVARMIASGEADLHLLVCDKPARPPADGDGIPLVALAKTAAPVDGAAVTIAIGEAGVDHDAVAYSARTGTLSAVRAREPSRLPAAAAVIGLIARHIDAKAAWPC
jgi:formylmethanofuran dehydrogenase subunit B